MQAELMEELVKNRATVLIRKMAQWKNGSFSLQEFLAEGCPDNKVRRSVNLCKDWGAMIQEAKLKEILDSKTRVYTRFDTDEELIAGLRRLGETLSHEIRGEDIRGDVTIPGESRYVKIANLEELNVRVGMIDILQAKGVLPNAQGELNVETRWQLRDLVRQLERFLVPYDIRACNGVVDYWMFVRAGYDIDKINQLIGSAEILELVSAYADNSPVLFDGRIDPALRERLWNIVRRYRAPISLCNIVDLGQPYEWKRVLRDYGGLERINRLIGADELLVREKLLECHAIRKEALERLQGLARRNRRRLLWADIRSLNNVNLSNDERVAVYLTGKKIKLSIMEINALLGIDRMLLEEELGISAQCDLPDCSE